LSATVIGAALGLAEVQVWKDVDGVLSADPREVEGTVAMAFLSFQEATELAYFGGGCVDFKRFKSRVRISRRAALMLFHALFIPYTLNPVYP
jgi:uridylate kinase